MVSAVKSGRMLDDLAELNEDEAYQEFEAETIKDLENALKLIKENNAGCRQISPFKKLSNGTF